MLGKDMVDVFARVNDCVARVGLLLTDRAFSVVLRQFKALYMSVQAVSYVEIFEFGRAVITCSWTNSAASSSCKRFVESMVCQTAVGMEVSKV